MLVSQELCATRVASAACRPASLVHTRQLLQAHIAPRQLPMTNAVVAEEAKLDLGSLVHGSLSENCWGQTAQRAKYPTADLDMRADVIVVGAGVAGLTTALELQQAGKDVIVLEAQLIGSGKSGRNEGVITPWKRRHFRQLLLAYKQGVAADTLESHKAAINYIKSLSNAQGIDCSLKPVDGYVFTYSGSEAAEKIGNEFAAAQFAGLTSTEVQLLNNVDLGSNSGKLDLALKFAGTYILDPVRYVHGLAEALTKAGGRIFEQSRVRQHGSKTCSTLSGRKVSANDAVVLTTGTPITKNLLDSSIRALSIHGKQVTHRRHVIALSLPEASANEGVYHDLEYPPYHVRISKNEAGKGLTLIASGEEHDQGIPADQFADYYSWLETWVRHKWPAVGKRTHQWSYQVSETADYLSYHGKDSSPGADWYVSYGDCGETLVTATIGGQIISDLILGKKNAFSQLYSPTRNLATPPLIPQIKPEYLINTVQAVAGQVLPQTTSPNPKDIHPGSGAIVQRGLQKLAVYKDDDGQLHQRSAVCPHLGCLVQWNPLERQWNCPCHGSCFDKIGCNIGGGPSTLDLAEVP